MTAPPALTSEGPECAGLDVSGASRTRAGEGEEDRTPQHVSQRAPGPALLSPAHLYHKQVLQDGNWELEAKIKIEKKEDMLPQTYVESSDLFLFYVYLKCVSERLSREASHPSSCCTTL